MVQAEELTADYIQGKRETTSRAYRQEKQQAKGKKEQENVTFANKGASTSAAAKLSKKITKDLSSKRSALDKEMN